MKKYASLSVSMPLEVQDKLRDHARRRGMSVASLIRHLCDHYLVAEDEIIPVILKIPMKLRGDPAALRGWLDAKSAAIAGALDPK